MAKNPAHRELKIQREQSSFSINPLVQDLDFLNKSSKIVELVTRAESQVRANELPEHAEENVLNSGECSSQKYEKTTVKDVRTQC